DPRGVTVHGSQWKYGFFERQVELPSEVASDEIRAEYEAGVLRIHVPKGAAPPPPQGMCSLPPRSGAPPEGAVGANPERGSEP
ncbi:MAG: Hsp20/alpha crystallin family protein, partial [Planctomycetes bacterium]|nr:Hsp20/alpha crystallin family protein [Planctomycetota bacterium]